MVVWAKQFLSLPNCYNLPICSGSLGEGILGLLTLAIANLLCGEIIRDGNFHKQNDVKKLQTKFFFAASSLRLIFSNLGFGTKNSSHMTIFRLSPGLSHTRTREEYSRFVARLFMRVCLLSLWKKCVIFGLSCSREALMVSLSAWVCIQVQSMHKSKEDDFKFLCDFSL